MPIEIDKFWSISKNKANLQKLFIEWVLENSCDEEFNRELFLGGSDRNNDFMCYSQINGNIKEERLLKFYHEEADDRIFFHANHAVKVGKCTSKMIASPDTDVFVSALHHFNHWKEFGLTELWIVSG